MRNKANKGRKVRRHKMKHNSFYLHSSSELQSTERVLNSASKTFFNVFLSFKMLLALILGHLAEWKFCQWSGAASCCYFSQVVKHEKAQTKTQDLNSVLWYALERTANRSLRTKCSFKIQTWHCFFLIMVYYLCVVSTQFFKHSLFQRFLEYVL